LKHLDPRPIIALTMAALTLIFLPGSAGSTDRGMIKSTDGGENWTSLIKMLRVTKPLAANAP